MKLQSLSMPVFKENLTIFMLYHVVLYTETWFGTEINTVADCITKLYTKKS